jgi:EAL domain-containing protein (putative c-di-GMP-specific phosphodiesterase class I)
MTTDSTIDAQWTSGFGPLKGDLKEGAVATATQRVIDGRQIQTVFQPLVHLATDEVVGYEALARGPEGSPVESPLVLLRAARAAGRLAELDWICAATAYRAAAEARLHPSTSIFINFEASTLLTPCPADLLTLIRSAQDRLRVLVMINEAQLIADPGRLFEALAQAREIGWGVALNNVEVSPSSLALLPLAHPDVIKIDLGRLRDNPLALAERGDAARMYSEQTGASMLVAGIEDGDDVQLARSIGAQYGQGWHHGGPAALPATSAVPRSVFPLLPAPTMTVQPTPFELIREHSPTSIIERRFLEPLCHYLVEQVDRNGPRALLLSSYPNGRSMPAGYYEKLSRLFDRAAFSVVFGPGLATVTQPYLRTGELDLADPMGPEWDVLVLGPHYVGALVARDLGDDGPVEHRRVEYAITHDRELVVTAARGFLRRVNAHAPGSFSDGASHPRA